ncbi:MAG: hypothetical protein Q9218_001620 [Villophora microphyllina]
MPITNGCAGARVKMGNNSSQLRPVSLNVRSSPAGHGGGGSSPWEDSKKKPSSKSEREIDKEELACMLMHLEGSRPRTPQWRADQVLASSQLLTESSPGPNSNVSSAVNDSEATTNVMASAESKQRRKKRKCTTNVLEASLDQSSPEASAKSQTVGKSSQVADQAEVPQAVHPLDVVDENDDDLSGLFQEYETQASQLEPPPVDDAESPVPSDHHLTDAAWADQSSHSTPTEHDRGKKRKEKRKRNAGSDASDVDAEQELLNGTGQHAFDIDFKAFDEIFANGDVQMANPFNEESGLDQPNGTQSPVDHFFHEANGETSAPLDDDLVQTDQRAEKPSRIPSLSGHKKRKRTEVPNSLDIQAPVYISPYAPTQGHQDNVLPGLEDLQARASSEIPFSQPSQPSNVDFQIQTKISVKHDSPPRFDTTKSNGNESYGDGNIGEGHDSSMQETKPKGGIFSDDEVVKLEAFRARYCEEEEITKQRFNDLVQTNVRESHEAKRLFKLLYEELPYRKHASIVRYCRRQFHNFSARGTWTEADDEELKNAVALKGKAWKAVGDMVGRLWEDCRDRYRNYHVNADQKTKERWTHDEVCRLAQGVDECMQLLRVERMQAKEEKYQGREMQESEPDSDQEAQDTKFINWQVVSERMGGSRSRLQCSYKWNHLKNADRLYYLRTIRRLAKGKGFKSNAEKEPWRLQRASRKLKNMMPGDRYEFLQAFIDCTAPTEQTITWQSLGSAEFRECWSTFDFKAALQLFKDETPGSAHMNYQEVVNRAYNKFIMENPGDLEEKWHPDVHGDVNELEKELKKAQREQKKPKDPVQTYEVRRQLRERKFRTATKVKSKAFIESDDDSDEGEVTDHRNLTKKGIHSQDEVFSTQEIANSGKQGSSEDECPEVGDSADEETRKDSSKRRSTASTEDNNEREDDAAYVRSSRTSDSDTDDSLFNDSSDIKEDLVGKLQSQRDT